MTSREIIRRCIEFRDPPRIGLHFWTDPIQGRVWPETDFACVAYQDDSRFHPKPGQTEWTTEWGITRRTIQGDIGEAVSFPLAGGWHLLEEYGFPDFRNPARYAHLPETVARAKAEGKYVYGHIPGLMLLPIDLRGMENWFLDHVEAVDSLGVLLDRITEIRLSIIEQYARAGVDGVITWDDMGTNESAFVSPDLFRTLYLPRYRRAIDALHERGMHFIHHCCGQVRSYLDLFAEAGCDVLQLDQPELMGIDWLGEHYGGKFCFWNCVDIQKTIGRGDLRAIEEEAERQVRRLGGFDGGFMVKAYQQPETVGMTLAEAEAQYRTFKEYAQYPLKR